ncbi:MULTISPECIES: glycoside hydrolase family 95 protein [Niastella]|uniref:Glycoside hydrolase family 95 protein n=1 Tax=Niastella soli TaxID=2821487 RepID=A0ABS3YLT6_9BACT|nr:glycoside hydrolase family 95 protein [Niastella soli]MBO9198854.1 glycoside hydrolase family 95 protein [Niastella soli]
MKNKLTIFCFLINASLYAQPNSDAGLKLWYNKPAEVWEEALPLGNGKTGAMVWGGLNEVLQLNDNTLWSGYPEAGNNPNGPIILPQVQQAVFEGDYEKAAALWKKMQGPYSARYLPLANLVWRSLRSGDIIPRIPKTYYRDLDLNNAVATVRYTEDSVNYQRETFISYPAKVLVMRITADKKGRIYGFLNLSSLLKYKVKPVAADYLVLQGKAPKFVANRDYEPQQVVYDSANGEGMNFEVHVKVRLEGGSVKQHDDGLEVIDADAVTIYLSEATSFNGFNRSPGLDGKDPAVEAKANLKKAIALSYEQLKGTHIRDYQSLFNRVEFKLAGNGAAKLPTDERLQQYASNPTDQQLQVLYYQFGRYLLISSSRPGSRPANLQGIWNEHVQPPWGSNYTTNINTEMNYWLAENTNLSECHQPLFDFMKELAVNGAQTAKVNYNISEGWVVHHNSDVWAKTSPPGGFDWDPKGMPRWSCWPMAGAWLSTHLWEHYLYTGDKTFLKNAWPLMKGAAQFMLHWLITDPANGSLVTNPSTSPENTMKIKGKEYQVGMATTMDMSIIRELFTAVIKSGDILKTDAAFCEQVIKAKEKLYPFHIGQYGQLQEWNKDWDDPNDKHRHLSHLFGLYPGSQINPTTTPDLAAAAKQSLIFRGDVSTGWSMAWKINWWARLQDGNHAYKILSDAFTYIDPRFKRDAMSGGGTYPNLFDAHPPFQIDGNFGATAGITELLLQSHNGDVALLPALPDAWKNGSIKGIKARGNFTVAIDWKEGKLLKASVISVLGGPCRISAPYPIKVLEVTAKKATGSNANVLTTSYGQPPYEKGQAKLTELKVSERYSIDFVTKKGRMYTVVPVE